MVFMQVGGQVQLHPTLTHALANHITAQHRTAQRSAHRHQAERSPERTTNTREAMSLSQGMVKASACSGSFVEGAGSPSAAVRGLKGVSIACPARTTELPKSTPTHSKTLLCCV